MRQFTNYHLKPLWLTPSPKNWWQINLWRHVSPGQTACFSSHSFPHGKWSLGHRQTVQASDRYHISHIIIFHVNKWSLYRNSTWQRNYDKFLPRMAWSLLCPVNVVNTTMGRGDTEGPHHYQVFLVGKHSNIRLTTWHWIVKCLRHLHL